jgi:succinate dehydrogenase/fumarate reductase flavoprotein subunit
MGTNLLQTRRSFIKGVGALTLAAAALGVSGCSAPAQTSSNDSASSVNDIKWDEETDVLVVGSGAAGMATAITLATEGKGLKTLLLEKGSMPGGNGNTPFSSGMFIGTEEPDRFYDYLQNLVGEYTGTPLAIYKAFADGSAENISWLTSFGMVMDDLRTMEFPTQAEWQEYPNSDSFLIYGFKPDNASGMIHTGVFLSKVVDDHADLIDRRTDSPLTSLIHDPNSKAVLGGVYESGGQSIYVKVNKAVVMCCGGFENDDVMKQDYLSLPRSHAAAGLCNTGDGHRICERLGASMWHMHSFAGLWTNGIKLDGSEMLPYRALKKAQGIVVGVNGRRFYMEWEGTTMIDNNWSAGSDMSLHYGCRHGHQNFGGDWKTLPLPDTSWFVFDANGLANSAYLGANAASNTLFTQNTTTQNAEGTDPVADGYGYKADTIEDLAKQMQVPIEELTLTVKQWNDSCANGNDEFYHRPVTTLTPIDTPPYYAVKCIPELLNTDGGPRRDESAHILDTEGEAIPNLYSAGEFGSIWADKYQGGGNISECMIFGRIAARNIIDNQ